MFPKQRPVPPEVSSWMEKDIAMGELTAATRLLTTDARQNIIVSRRFFADLLSLSFERYRKILTCNFEKNNFLKNQRAKSETSMPGLRPYVDQLILDSDGVISSGNQSNKNDGNSLTSPSPFSRLETKSDSSFNRRPDSSIPRIKTAQTMKSDSEIPPSLTQKKPTNQRPLTGIPIIHERLNHSAHSKKSHADTTPIPASKKPINQRPLTGIQTSREQLDHLAQRRKSQIDITPIIASKKPTHQRPVTRQQISRERLDYLAQPKNYRFKSAGTDHIRSNTVEQPSTSDELFGEIDKISQATISRMHSALTEKSNTAVQDNRFRHLINVFSEVHHAKTPDSQTVKSIIQSNASLQDEKGRWKAIRPTAANCRPVFRNRRQTLADKLNNKLDVFLIDVGA